MHDDIDDGVTLFDIVYRNETIDWCKMQSIAVMLYGASSVLTHTPTHEQNTLLNVSQSLMTKFHHWIFSEQNLSNLVRNNGATLSKQVYRGIIPLILVPSIFSSSLPHAFSFFPFARSQCIFTHTARCVLRVGCFLSHCETIPYSSSLVTRVTANSQREMKQNVNMWIENCNAVISVPYFMRLYDNE